MSVEGRKNMAKPAEFENKSKGAFLTFVVVTHEVAFFLFYWIKSFCCWLLGVNNLFFVNYNICSARKSKQLVSCKRHPFPFEHKRGHSNNT